MLLSILSAHHDTPVITIHSHPKVSFLRSSNDILRLYRGLDKQRNIRMLTSHQPRCQRSLQIIQLFKNGSKSCVTLASGTTNKHRRILADYKRGLILFSPKLPRTDGDRMSVLAISIPRITISTKTFERIQAKNASSHVSSLPGITFLRSNLFCSRNQFHQK